MHRQITIILVLMALLGLALTAAAQDTAPPPADAAKTATPGGSASPSQVTRERINQIRANEFFYQSFGRDDPFKVLVSGDFEQVGAAEMVDINSATLVGVMWGQEDRFALVENGEGFGYILRVGDRVQHGRVVSIRKNSITARITLYGISNSVVLKLEETED
jgi:hypothetical protein